MRDQFFSSPEWISIKSAWNLALDMNDKNKSGYVKNHNNDIQAHRVGQPAWWGGGAAIKAKNLQDEQI